MAKNRFSLKSLLLVEKQIKPKAEKPKKKVKTTKTKDPSVTKLAVKTSQNCLFCVKFNKCNDRKKSHNYICKLYKPYAEKSKSTELDAPIKINIKKDKYTTDQLDFAQMAKDYNEMANLSPLPPDLKIDDRDLPQAKNFLEFTTSPNYLGIKPFAKQLEIGLQTFAEVCPNKSCTNAEYLSDIPKSDTVEDILEQITPFEWGVCPKCGYRKHQLLADGFKVPHTGVVMAGQRSGKSALTAMVHTYLLHGYLKLQNAPKVMGLLDNEILEDTLVALTATKAKSLLYSKVEGYLKQSKWFQDYHSMLDTYGNKYGEELYRVRDTFASYRCRSLIVKTSDPDMRKLRGPTSYAASVDELGWFISGKGNNVKFDAGEILASLDNSFATVRLSYLKLLKQGMDGLLSPMFFNISSPSSKKDLIVKSHDDAKHDKFAISFCYATWEFNPEFNRRYFNNKFRKNPIEAMRDFGAVPPNSSAPFISDIDHIRGIVAKERRNTVNFIPQTIRSVGGKEMGSGKVMFVAPKDQNKRIMAIDAGYNDNSFAIVCGYWDTNLERPVIDTFVEIPASHDLPLNYTDIFIEIVSPMIDQLNVKALVADRFQSIKFLQDMEHEKQILTETHSVKYGAFESFRIDLLNNDLIIPKPEIKRFDDIISIAENDYPHGFRRSPISHFLHQIVTVQDLKKEVIKGEGLTDDLFRASVLLHCYLVDLLYRDYCSGTTNIVIPSKIIAGVYSGRTSGMNTHNSAGTMANAGAGIAISSRG